MSSVWLAGWLGKITFQLAIRFKAAIWLIRCLHNAWHIFYIQLAILWALFKICLYICLDFPLKASAKLFGKHCTKSWISTEKRIWRRKSQTINVNISHKLQVDCQREFQAVAFHLAVDCSASSFSLTDWLIDGLMDGWLDGSMVGWVDSWQAKRIFLLRWFPVFFLKRLGHPLSFANYQQLAGEIFILARLARLNFSYILAFL